MKKQDLTRSKKKIVKSGLYKVFLPKFLCRRNINLQTSLEVILPLQVASYK